MTQAMLLRGGRVVDPTCQLDGIASVRIRGGVVTAVGALDPEAGERIIDVAGLTVAPGLIDVHVHLREPGQEWKETTATGTAAAAAGGFTTIFCMPNTEPALDTVVALEELKRRTVRDATIRVRPIAAVSEGRRGRRAVDFAALALAGAVGFSDDGESTRDSGVMLEALSASRRLGLPVMVHCEDPGLIGGAMHEGDISRQIGIAGLPAAAEEIIIARDLALAKLSGGWLHVCHVSTGDGAELIARAKRDRVHVTAEVMPHHLTMSDEWVGGSRQMVNVNEGLHDASENGQADTKVNPPLRPAGDACRLLDALNRDVIDLVATDHAPHGLPEKVGRPFAAAAFGLSGSEFALPLMLGLVRAGKITMTRLVAAMSSVSARLWRLGGGSLRPGLPADIVVFDPDEQWVVCAERLKTRSANSPLLGRSLQGRVKMTLVGGDERYRDW